MKIAVILFPGTNCENETLAAVKAAGMNGKILRWNTKEKIEDYDGFVLPGGWSYEDRIRAGVISAQDPIMLRIKEQAKEGKPVLGICNGCQVLVETGMIPGLKDKIEMALAPNINPMVSGFYCTWTNLKAGTKKKTAFNLTFDENDVLPIPIAHGEGRFATIDKGLLGDLKKNGQIMFRYCDKEGNVDDKFPINPNGSVDNIAGICNKEGNVLAMMPHPERASWLHQVPEKHQGGEKAALGLKIFESMKEYIKKNQ
ncbi:phosphoribosylformylglycinamidine synthase I [Candidatus Woesearchaeota archaeon]|nr:phosphoribosylformylglycinamidine synthase I [Candidatus Woesearchaeota archaeon]